MDSEYFEKLSKDNQYLVNSLEKQTNKPISVVIDQSKDSMGCDVNLLRLLTPSKEYFNDGSVLHELLHIKRILIDEIPKLTINDTDNTNNPEYISQKLVYEIDNIIEHLCIIPEEIEAIPERKEYWETQINNELDKIINDPNYYLPNYLNFVVYLQGMLIYKALYTKKEIYEKLKLIEDNNGYSYKFKDIRDKMSSFENKKEDLIRKLFEFFNIPQNNIIFLYYKKNGIQYSVKL